MDSFYEQPRMTPKPSPILQDKTVPSVPEVSLVFGGPQVPSPVDSYNAWKLQSARTHNESIDVTAPAAPLSYPINPRGADRNNSFLKKVRFEANAPPTDNRTDNRTENQTENQTEIRTDIRTDRKCLNAFSSPNSYAKSYMGHAPNRQLDLSVFEPVRSTNSQYCREDEVNAMENSILGWIRRRNLEETKNSIEPPKVTVPAAPKPLINYLPPQLPVETVRNLNSTPNPVVAAAPVSNSNPIESDNATIKELVAIVRLQNEQLQLLQSQIDKLMRCNKENMMCNNSQVPKNNINVTGDNTVHVNNECDKDGDVGYHDNPTIGYQGNNPNSVGYHGNQGDNPSSVGYYGNLGPAPVVGYQGSHGYHGNQPSNPGNPGNVPTNKHGGCTNVKLNPVLHENNQNARRRPPGTPKNTSPAPVHYQPVLTGIKQPSDSPLNRNRPNRRDAHIQTSDTDTHPRHKTNRLKNQQRQPDGFTRKVSVGLMTSFEVRVQPQTTTDRQDRPIRRVQRTNETECSLLLDEPLNVQEIPESPDNSIHVDMHEYESESDDECSADDDTGWTFYNNILGQVNNILRNSPSTDDSDDRSGRPARPAALTDRTLCTIKQATLERLRHDGNTGEQLDPSELSLAVTQLLMKYLPDEQRADPPTRRPARHRGDPRPRRVDGKILDITALKRQPKLT